MHQRFVEALLAGSHRIIVAEVPFAENARAVASGLQSLRDRDFLPVHFRAPP